MKQLLLAGCLVLAILGALAVGCSVLVGGAAVKNAAEGVSESRPAPTPEPARPELQLEVTACNRQGPDLLWAVGTLTNPGPGTVYDVEIATIWTDSSGRVVDTGSEHAVGFRERLGPGDTVAWKDPTSVRGAATCSAKIKSFEVMR